MTKRACEQYGSVQRRIEIMLTMYLRSVSGETLRGTSEHLRIEYGIDLPPNLLKTYLTRLRIRFRPVLVQVAMAYDLADIVSFDQRNDVAGHNVHIISVRDEIRRALARGSIPHD